MRDSYKLFSRSYFTLHNTQQNCLFYITIFIINKVLLNIIFIKIYNEYIFLTCKLYLKFMI